MWKQHPVANSEMFWSESRFLFHCTIKIKIPARFSTDILNAAFDLMYAIDRKYNSHVPGSHFYNINTQAGTWVETDATTIRLIEALKNISMAVDGHYDISIMPLLRTWGFYTAKATCIPDAAAIRTALNRIAYRHIEVRGHQVRIRPDMELITGSFLKAYAVDQVKTFLTQQGVTAALINAGGSTIMGMNDSDTPFWKVQVPQPAAEEPEAYRLRNNCLNYSASRPTGQEHGHILSAKTGWPSGNRQVALFTDNAFEGDALSTAIMTIPSRERPIHLARLRQQYSFTGKIINDQAEEVDI